MRELTKSQLQQIARVSMFVDHLFLTLFLIQKIQPNDLPFLIGRGFGVVAFPIFAYFVVEGVYKTSNLIKYGLQLFILAILSEPIYQKLFFESAKGNHNILYLFALFVFYSFFIQLNERTWEDDIPSPIKSGFKWLINGFLTLSAIGSAFYFNLDYSWYGMLLLFGLYFTKGYSVRLYKYSINFDLFVVALFYLYRYYNIRSINMLPFSLLTIYLLSKYKGEKGTGLKGWGYFFYPAHLFFLIQFKKYF